MQTGPNSSSSPDLAGHHPTSTGRRVLVNTTSLAGSSLWRIFISFVLQVLISRALGVAQFGQYVSALAFLNVAQVVGELGLPTLLVRDLAQAPTMQRAYYHFALRVQLIAALTTWAGLIGLTLLLPISLETREALWLVGASLPFYAVTSATETLFRASERMELVMSVEATINTLIMALSIVVLLMGGGILALITVLVVTQAISALLCWWLLRRHALPAEPQERVQLSLRQLWQDMRPFYWLTLADVLLHRLDILLLNVFAGDFVTGLYSLAYSVVRVVVKLIQSYWQALYPTLSRLHQHAERQYDLLSTLSLRYGLMVVLPGAVIGVGVAGDVLQFIFGEDAAASARTFQILLTMTPFFLVEMYGVTQLMVSHRTRNSLQITWIHIAAVALLLPLLTVGWGAVGAAMAMVLASLIGAVGSLLLLRQYAMSLQVSKLPVLLAATALAGAIGYWLPTVWLLRAGAAALFYLIVVWATGVFAPHDRTILRSALRVPRAPAALPTD